MPPARHNPRPLAYWHTLILQTVRGVSPTDADAIAGLCAAADARGENPAVWHHAAAYFGTPCHCAPCERQRT